jgi:hypothetical protein
MSWIRRGGRLALDRRTFLRGALGATAISVGLPALNAMFNDRGTALAVDGTTPRRFGLFFWGNGNRPERWVPAATGDGDAWALSESLAPLAPIKHKLLVITGADIPFSRRSPHGSGATALLSGSEVAEAADHFSHLHPTLDQVIAQSIGDATLYRSIETGVHASLGRSFTGAYQRAPALTSPFDVWTRLFGPTFRLPGDAVDPRLGLRRSALDAVIADLTSLQPQLGAFDRARLDQHLTGVRELELRLARLESPPPVSPACVRPDPPGERWDTVEVHHLMCDLLVMAWTCDLTRVFSHWYSDPESAGSYPGISSGHHELTHNEPGDQPQVLAILDVIVSAYAELLLKLDAVPEGAGTLLDTAAVFATSEVSDGRTHSFIDLPMLIGGGACGALHTDRHVRAVGASTSGVPLALLWALGVPAPSFGVDAGYADTPLDGLLT